MINEFKSPLPISLQLALKSHKCMIGEPHRMMMEEIKSNPEWCFVLAMKYKCIVEECEDAIATSAEYSYAYLTMLHNESWRIRDKNRISKLENAISTSAEHSYLYAKNIIKNGKKGWPKGETAISRSLEYSYLYATKILHKRFVKGEHLIVANRDYLDRYKQSITHRCRHNRNHPVLQLQYSGIRELSND